MDVHTKFLLDSGDPDEYKEIANLAKSKGKELWGATTNPSLIAKKLSGKKITQKEAFELQKQIILEITEIVPGAVSAEVYADEKTTAEEMIEQGKEIATWHKRVVVKLPTTVEAFKARTELRKTGIAINNTLVFSQQQIFAICLHEQITQKLYGPIIGLWPPFISPFVGRLDDINEDGMMLVDNGMKIKKGLDIWMLEASVRRLEHMKIGINLGTELITAPAKTYREFFALTNEEIEKMDTNDYRKDLSQPNFWIAADDLKSIDSVTSFTQALESGLLDISHPLTDKGIARFAEDWKAIIAY